MPANEGLGAGMKIAAATGSRADYGLLEPVLREIARDPRFRLELFVTGMHLSPEFGLTWQEIAKDGFDITEKIESLLSSDTGTAVAKAMGLTTILMSDALARRRPDLLLVLGDRFEILAAVQAALVALIPVAHIAGGDSTEGAFDEAIRHSITKMAHLHFVTHADAARRVRQLGEDPARIVLCGNPGLDSLRSLTILDRDAFAASVGLELRRQNFLVTFHPATLEIVSASEQFAALLAALDRFEATDTGLIFTLPNADPQGRKLIGLVHEYVTRRQGCVVHASLGRLRYLSALHHVDVVIGNSSSGLLEAPSFRKPTVNIGSRQQGRPAAASVVTVEPGTEAIHHAIQQALQMDCSKVVNPYGDGHAAARIVAALRQIEDPQALLKKHFFDLPQPAEPEVEGFATPPWGDG